jgi:hypothetical protein
MVASMSALWACLPSGIRSIPCSSKASLTTRWRTKAAAGDLEVHRRVLGDVPYLGLAEAGDKSPLGLERPGLAAEVGAEDVDRARAVIPRDRLGVLGLAASPAHAGVQPLYLPAFLLRGTAPVPDGGDAVLDLALVEHRPEPEVPPLRPEQRPISMTSNPEASLGCKLRSI